jgi:DHA2 family multidrug resistance protein
MSRAVQPRSAAPPGDTRTVTARDWIGFFGMVLGMFMAILDIQIVASSLAEIRAGVNASVDEIGWVQTSYLIAEVIMIPLSGWLARVFSTRWLFLASCGTFTAASVACAFAWNLESLIVFRAIQGFLGGAMIPTVFATAFSLFPRSRQPTISVPIGLVATMAPTLGPTLGGWITQTVSWHWLFLVNLAPGAVVCALVLACVDFDQPRLELLRRFDLLGIVLVAVFLGCLEYVLEEGPGDDWLESRKIVVVGAISVTAAALMMWRELTIEHPVIDLRAFHDRNFAVGCLYSFIIGIGLYGSVYVIPMFFAQVRGWNSLEIGLTMVVVGLFQFISAPLAGALSKRLDLRVMLAAGLSLFGVGLYLNHLLTSEWGFWEMLLPQALRGLSLMLCFVPINRLALGTLPRHELQNAAGLYNLMRNLGGAIGLAVINTVLAARHDLHLLRIGERWNAGHLPFVEKLGAMTSYFEGRLGDHAASAALKKLHGLATREAMVLSFADVLLLMSVVFLVGLCLMPLVRKVSAPSSQSDH